MAAIVAAFVIGMLASVQSVPTIGQTATAADIAQGQYIVTNVARCIGCHGVNLGGFPANPSNPEFVPRPKIAGLPMFSNDADAVKFLETGLMPDGSKPKPPMAQFNLHHSDAVAVVAYLRSLK
jgi:mono/diheme cytochrome c family protein